MVDSLQVAHDVRDEVKVIATEMDECVIPINIALRKSELGKLSEKLDAMIHEFEHLRSADEDFEGDGDNEKEMRRMVLNFDSLLKDLEREKKSLLEIQEGQLEKYNTKDF